LDPGLVARRLANGTNQPLGDQPSNAIDCARRRFYFIAFLRVLRVLPGSAIALVARLALTLAIRTA